MPSTSGRAATYPKRSDKLKFFNELKDLRDRLRQERPGQGVGTSSITTEIPAGQESSQNSADMSKSVSSSAVVDGTIPDGRPQQVAVIVDPGNCSRRGLDVSQNTQSSKAGQMLPHQAQAMVTNSVVGGAQQGSPSGVPAEVTSPYFQKKDLSE